MGVLQPKKQNKVVLIPRKTDVTGNDHVRPKEPVSERQRIVSVESMLPGCIEIPEIIYVIQPGAQRCGCLRRAKGSMHGRERGHKGGMEIYSTYNTVCEMSQFSTSSHSQPGPGQTVIFFILTEIFLNDVQGTMADATVVVVL